MVIVIDKKIDKKKVDAALQKLSDSKKKTPKLSDFYGKLEGVFGDGLEYQKKIRSEWD